jgi:hypothetical protein
MDKKSWEIAQDIYEKYGDLNLKDFQKKIDELSLKKEIREMLIELKKSENEASSYFDRLKKNVSNYLEPTLSEILEYLKKKK